MADENINIIISATDRASMALKGVLGSVGALGIAIGVMGAAYKAYNTIMEATVNVAIKYADQVRQLSLLNGTSAQETSRIIQVTDDYKVSVQALTMATRTLSKQGLSLTIGSLAKMSDEYKSLGTNADKTRFLLDKFGRSGMQFAEIMNQGSDAIRRQSTEIEKGLILSQKELDVARKLQFQQDQLADTRQAYSVALGNKIIPTQVRYLDSLTRILDGESALQVMWGNADWFLEKNATSYDFATSAAERYRKKIKQLPGDLSDAADAVNLLGIAMSGIGDSGAEMAAGLYQAKLAADGVLDEADVQNILNFREAIGLLTAEERSAADTAIALAAAINGLPADRVLTVTTWYLSGYGKAEGSYGGAVKTPSGSTRRASGGSIPAGGTAWVGDSPGGLTPYSELVYAPHGAQVFKASESRAMASGAPRAAMGGTIPAMTGETNLSYSTIRQLASAIAGEMSRING